MNQRNDDITLIDDTLHGNPQAYRLLVERHQQYAFTLAFNILNHREEAEEAAQDAFVRAHKALASFNRTAKFTTWLYRIVLNCALAVKERRKPRHEDLDTAFKISDTNASADQTKQAEQRFYLQRAIAQLNSDDAAVITLFYLQENSIEEVAQITALEINNVKVKLHRARKRLADILQQQLKGEAKSLIH